MKLNRYFLIAAMGLGLFACTDDLDNNGGQKDNEQKGEMTYAAIRFDFSGATSRATTGYGDGKLPGEGTAATDAQTTLAEKAIKSIRLIITDTQGKVEYNKLFTKEDDLKPDKLYTTSLQAGDKKFYAFINERDEANAAGGQEGTSKKFFDKYGLGATFNENTLLAGEADTFYDLTTTASTGKGFMMSGFEEYPIIAGVTEEQVNQPGNVENAVSIDVERIVAKVTVHLANTYDNDKNAAEYGVKLNSLVAAIGNADLKYQKTVSEIASWGTYAIAYNENNVRQSPGFSTWVDDSETEDKDELAYNQAFIRFTTPVGTGVEGDVLLPKVTGAEGDTYPEAIYYCLENTHAVGTYKKGNTTFTRIIATMIPTSVIEFDYTAATGTEAPATPAEINPKEGTPKATVESFYTIDGIPEGEDTELIKAYVLQSHLVTLYETLDAVLDEDDKEAVTNAEVTEQDALKATAVINYLKTHDYVLSDEYKGGKGYFYTWVNHLKDHGYLNTAPVFRNDWYDLSITNIVLPGSPTEGFGDGGGKEELDPDTWLSVNLTIKPWNIIEHNVDLQ